MKARKNKDILNSSFTFPILSKIYNGYRPAQIAAQLGTSPQAVKYYTDKMVNAGLIRKEKGDRIKWVIEQKGLLVLKQKVTGSVNSFTNYQTKPVARIIPTRLDNLSFKFKIRSPRGFGVRKKDVAHLLSEGDYIPPLGAPDYVNRISLQLNMPDKTKDLALHLVKEMNSIGGTSPVIRACCAVLLASEEEGLNLSSGKITSALGVTTAALWQALIRFKG